MVHPCISLASLSDGLDPNRPVYITYNDGTSGFDPFASSRRDNQVSLELKFCINLNLVFHGGKSIKMSFRNLKYCFQNQKLALKNLWLASTDLICGVEDKYLKKKATPPRNNKHILLHKPPAASSQFSIDMADRWENLSSLTNELKPLEWHEYADGDDLNAWFN